ncbi:FKBP-type peptidyl-prolyl cis-trans isomerase [Maribellus maritimus]|uniref:FKBP-type peptidyl-prolyl cis-trans isomerase n=1 Tax=Maribellus maritimus TaxID=2870838 RepID=UPI001EECCC1A|nr:FKBP-type peptidyl-prolyl cis-trans isomerase [Maribellus maritimus]MCG6190971.1 FKBP-type peptidyl-prolyl cis-trans isomerase [Maribellus maritimus]
MKIFRISGLLSVVILIAFSSCKDDNNGYERMRKQELEILDAYITEHNYTDYRKPSGLYYKETEAGTGDSIQVGDQVQIFYSTWALIASDSIVLIDESEGYSLGLRYEPYEFIVGEGSAISGLEEAATYMRKGTKASLVLPSEIAYGQSGTYGVSGFTTLLMEVEVYKVFRAEVPEESEE